MLRGASWLPLRLCVFLSPSDTPTSAIAAATGFWLLCPVNLNVISTQLDATYLGAAARGLGTNPGPLPVGSLQVQTVLQCSQTPRQSFARCCLAASSRRHHSLFPQTQPTTRPRSKTGRSPVSLTRPTRRRPHRYTVTPVLPTSPETSCVSASPNHLDSSFPSDTQHQTEP